MEEKKTCMSGSGRTTGESWGLVGQEVLEKNLQFLIKF
jgi:hypothetical protein